VSTNELSYIAWMNTYVNVAFQISISFVEGFLLVFLVDNHGRAFSRLCNNCWFFCPLCSFWVLIRASKNHVWWRCMLMHAENSGCLWNINQWKRRWESAETESLHSYFLNKWRGKNSICVMFWLGIVPTGCMVLYLRFFLKEYGRISLFNGSC
jgi:hypothetical protein